MIHPDKWRETSDPFALPFHDFELKRVLGYPHAGNDVFYVEGIYKGESCRAYIKVERQAGADVLNEAQIISHIPFKFKPEVLDLGVQSPAFIVTREAPGERLSMIVGDNADMRSLAFMREYGRALAMFHGLDMPCGDVKHRRFFDIPGAEYIEKYGLREEEEFLRSHSPEGSSRCFVHGDLHYANLLWQGSHISAVLDYELSGYGVREFDMAWALVLRPGQRFLDTLGEIERFLVGYVELHSFSRKAFGYYYVLIASRFYGMGDAGYQLRLKRIMSNFMNQSI